jgi:hypothetical protein
MRHHDRPGNFDNFIAYLPESNQKSEQRVHLTGDKKGFRGKAICYESPANVFRARKPNVISTTITTKRLIINIILIITSVNEEMRHIYRMFHKFRNSRKLVYMQTRNDL